jgi:hypothetical protein
MAARSGAGAADEPRARPEDLDWDRQDLPQRLQHDPGDLNRAREIASSLDPIPVGILFRNPDVPCYEELRNTDRLRSPQLIKTGLETEFDKFTIWPQEAQGRAPVVARAAAGENDLAS